MNVLFAHDHIFYKYKNEYYTRGGLSLDLLQKYRDIFGSLTIVSRQENIEVLEEGLALANYKNINFIKVPNFKKIKKIKEIFRAKEIIKSEVKKADKIIVRLPSEIGNIAIRMAKKYNIPYSVEVVGCAFDAHWYHSNLGKLVAIPSFLLMKKNVKNAQFASYVSKSFLQKRYPANGKKIGISDVNLIETQSDVLEKRLQRIESFNNNTVLKLATIGSVEVKYKGQEYVLQAITKLKSKGIIFDYYLIGGGDNKRLRELAKELGIEKQIVFVGPVKHKDIFNYLDNIDIYIQPSMTEGIPRSILEAMSRGCMAIGSRVGGIPELIDEKYLVARKNSNEIFRILNNLTKTELKNIAVENYQKTQEYSFSILDEKRTEFIKEYFEK